MLLVCLVDHHEDVLRDVWALLYLKIVEVAGCLNQLHNCLLLKGAHLIQYDGDQRTLR